MTTESPGLREVLIAWEALEDAFENNAPEVHSYLNVENGDVLRIVDGIAEPSTHVRIAADSGYLRVEPVSSREQYRWMERFIATVEDPELHAKLAASIDGKGAFRRFKDVLMAYAVDRERWFAFRSERLRTAIEVWLESHGLKAKERAAWPVPTAEQVKTVVERHHPAPAVRPVRASANEGARARIRELSDALPARELDLAVEFLEFLRERRAPRQAPSTHAAPSGTGDPKVGAHAARGGETGNDEGR